MGGGGAMRAAAKVAGFGVLNGGLRGVVPDHPVSTATRRIAPPVTRFAASSSPGSSDNVKVAAAAAAIDQKPCWQIDDWEFAAGGEGDSFLASSGQATTTRIVFGGPPSLEEAREATFELNSALEKAHLSASATPRSGLSGLSKSEALETKACVTREAKLAPSVPKHAIQAFRFLKESPAVQGVVASIASDPNVWNAVLLNPTLQEYLQSQKINAPSSTWDQDEKDSTGDGDMLFPRSPRSGASDSVGSMSGESNSTKRLMDFWQDMKLTVVDMMNHLSDYFQTMFGGYSGDKVQEDANENMLDRFVDKALGPSLIMGLAVMVMLVVVLKRA